MKPSYNVLKTIVFEREAPINFAVDTLITATWGNIRMNDLNAPGYFICGFMGQHTIYDDAIADKYFNHFADVAVYSKWKIKNVGAGIIGDDFNISVGNPRGQNNIYFRSDLQYKFREAPIYFSGNRMDIDLEFGVFGYTPAGSLYHYYQCIIEIGYMDDSEKASNLKFENEFITSQG